MKSPLISVVVPIYNVERYLGRCVDSLLSQKYENLEIILVNDGSTDGCAKICDEYESRDSRITVIHKKNGGLSDARNAGLKLSKGDYIAFADSDDYVSRYYISTLYELITNNDVEIAACDFRRVKEDDAVAADLNESESTVAVFTNTEALIDVFSTNGVCSIVTWNKLYKMSLFLDNGIQFPVGKIHEDNFTTYKLVVEAKTIAHINRKLYNYTYREDSITGKGFNANSFDKIEAVEEASRWLNRRGVNIENQFDAYRLSVYLDVMNLMVDVSGPINKLYWARVRTMILRDWKTYYRNNVLSAKQKIAIFFVLLGKQAYRFSRQVFKVLGSFSRRKN